MWCISDMGMSSARRAKMIKIFAIYIQVSGFPGQSSEYTFDYSRKQLRRYGISLSYSSPGVDCCFLCVGGLSSSCWCRFPSRVRCTHLLSPVPEAKSVLFEFALSRRLSRSRRTRCKVGWLQLVYNVDVVCRWVSAIQVALVACFRQVSSLAFSLVLSWVPYRYLIVDIYIGL